MIKTLNNMGHPLPEEMSIASLEKEMRIANARSGGRPAQTNSKNHGMTPPMATRSPLPDELSDPTLGGTRHVPPMMASQNQAQVENMIKTLNNMGHPLPEELSIASLEKEMRIANARSGGTPVKPNTGNMTPLTPAALDILNEYVENGVNPGRLPSANTMQYLADNMNVVKGSSPFTRHSVADKAAQA